MPRAYSGAVRRQRIKKIMKLAKGHYGGAGKRYRMAMESVKKGGVDAYVGRKMKKRDYRHLWIIRIKAAVNMRDLSYSKFIDGLKKANIDINRKLLAEIAVSDPSAFDKIVAIVKPPALN